MSVPISPEHRLKRPGEYPTIENLIGRLGLLVYFALLLIAALWLDWRGGDSVPVIAVRHLRAVSRVVPATTLPVIVDAVRFAPLGLLAALALPRRRRRSKRYLYVIAPAAAVAIFLAAIVMAVEADVSSNYGLALPLALVWCAGGAWIGASWVRGWRARLLAIPKLAGVALLLAAVAGVFTYLIPESELLRLDAPALISDTTRRLYDLIRGNTKKIDPGVSATLPTTIAFRASSDHNSAKSYLLEVFANGANPNTASAIASSSLGKPTPDATGEITVDISSFFNGLAPGTYVVTVSAMGPKGQGRSTAVTVTR